MIFLRRAKKYMINRLSSDILYKVSNVSIINKVLYGSLIDTCNNFEHYYNVTCYDYRKYWLTNDPCIISDEKYSKKMFDISVDSLGKVQEYFICSSHDWIYKEFYTGGHYYYINKTLYGFRFGNDIFEKTNYLSFILIKIIQ